MPFPVVERGMMFTTPELRFVGGQRGRGRGPAKGAGFAFEAEAERFPNEAN